MSGFGVAPFGTVPFGTSGLGEDPPADLTASASGSAAASGALTSALAAIANARGVPTLQLTVPLVEALEAGDAIAPDVLANLVAQAHASGSIELAALLAGNLEARARAWDTVLAAWQLMLTGDVTADDESEATARRFAALTDTLLATGLASSSMVAQVSCVAAAVLEDLVSAGYGAELIDTAQLADAIVARAHLVGLLGDTGEGTASADPILRISVIANEEVSAAATLESLLRANVDLADSAVIYAAISIGGTDYVGWVMNTKLKAATRHTNTPFDSFASFKGKDYAAGPGGIVRFDNTTSEDGTPISWSLRTFLMDFASTKYKRVPDVYIATTAGGALVLKVLSRDPKSGVLVEDWYVSTRVPSEEPGRGRFELGQGLKSTFFRFELTATAGTEFELDELDFRPLLMDRRT